MSMAILNVLKIPVLFYFEFAFYLRFLFLEQIPDQYAALKPKSLNCTKHPVTVFFLANG